MAIFATEIMEEVEGCQQTFQKLSVDGRCLFDEFEIEVSRDTTYFSEFKTLLSYMNYVANGQSLPETKFRIIKGNSSSLKQYEFKSKHLRIYVCPTHGGKLVIMGGYKKNQTSDLSKLKKLAKDYLEFSKILQK